MLLKGEEMRCCVCRYMLGWLSGWVFCLCLCKGLLGGLAVWMGLWRALVGEGEETDLVWLLVSKLLIYGWLVSSFENRAEGPEETERSQGSSANSLFAPCGCLIQEFSSTESILFALRW